MKTVTKKDLLLLVIEMMSDEEIERLWKAIFKIQITIKPNNK